MCLAMRHSRHISNFLAKVSLALWPPEIGDLKDKLRRNMMTYTEEGNVSSVKSKFTLHPDYKNFNPGISKLDFKSLSLVYNIFGCFGMLIPLFSCSFMFVMSCWLATFGVVQDQLFLLDGTTTTAQVTKCRIEKSKNVSNPNVDYIYVVNGQIYTDHYNSLANQKTCEEYPEGTSLQILYLSADPTNSRIIEPGTQKAQAETGFVYGVMVFMALFCLHFVVWSGRSIWRYLRAKRIYQRLLTNSILLEGEITSIRGEERAKSSGCYIVMVRYQFESAHGKRLKGYSEALRNDLKGVALPPVGTPVTVLYADDGAHTVL
jgi:hypothetical protein